MADRPIYGKIFLLLIEWAAWKQIVMNRPVLMHRIGGVLLHEWDSCIECPTKGTSWCTAFTESSASSLENSIRRASIIYWTLRRNRPHFSIECPTTPPWNSKTSSGSYPEYRRSGSRNSCWITSASNRTLNIAFIGNFTSDKYRLRRQASSPSMALTSFPWFGNGFTFTSGSPVNFAKSSS